MKLVAALVALVMSLAVKPSTIDACSCTSPRVRSVPGTGEQAPVNTHVYLFVPPRAPSVRGFSLYESNPSGRQPGLDYTLREIGSGGTRVLELIPKRPLKPSTKYAVRDGNNEIVTEFETTKFTDVTSPQLAGVRAMHVQDQVVCCMCMSGAPYTSVQMTGASDDTNDANQLLAAVWVADARGAIDYTQAPTAIVRTYDGSFTLGGPSICSPSNFTFPSTTSLKVGVKLLDFAGNETDAIDLRFAISKPLQRTRHP